MSDNAAVDRLNALVAKLVAAIRPPPNVTVSEWAAQNRVLSPEASAEQGRWRNDRTPYLVEIMDAYSDPRVHHIVVVASSQVGKSEFENNVIGRTIDVDPGSILFIHPVQTDAKEYSKLRIAPMIRDCPTLRAKVAESKSRDSGNTILQKSYPGGILTMCGSTEAHALASKPIRYVLGDERDRWATSAGTEGDPWELAMARQTTFYNAKAVEVSTPTIKGHSAIAKSYVKGTMERWVSQCPHCKGFHELRWEDIRYEYDTIETHGEKTYKVKDVWYLCPECACISDEVTMKRAPAHWQAENPAAYENGIRSFWLNSFVSQWAAWKDTVLKYLNALGDTKKIRNYAQYVETGLEPAYDNDRAMRMLWKVVKAFDDMNAQKRQERIEKNRRSANKRWNDEKCKCIQTHTNDANAYAGIKPERKTDTVPSRRLAWRCMSLHSPQERWW